MLRGGSVVLAGVFLISVFNLALGYAVAATLAEPPFWAGWSLPAWIMNSIRRKAASIEPLSGESRPVGSEKTDTPINLPQPAIAGVEELPPRWLEQLAGSGIVPKSYVEASAHVMRLDVGRYREQLLTAEGRARASHAEGDGNALRLVSEDLAMINQDWLTEQTSATQMLAQRSGRLGEHEALAKAVEQALFDQAAHIRLVSKTLETLEFGSDAEIAGRRLLEKVATLVDSAHVLRDRLQELLSTLLRTGKQLQALSANIQLDPLTGMPNRVGAETLFDFWWREDPERTRLLSAGLIDVDRFSRVNERLGTRGGDRAISALARLFLELIHKDRDFDRLARLGGQTFLVVFGDAGPHNALASMERVRQTVEAATFDDQGAALEMTVSCGVVEVGRREGVLDVLRRAGQTLTFAKKAGRNRCAIDEGAGPVTLPPPPLAVQGRTVTLAET
jgi:diguanylate cyclase (GGDEF)-like protein